MINIAILTFDGFNEIDSFVALNILNRITKIHAKITSNKQTITSMNKVQIQTQKSLEFANTADVVLVGSGTLTRQIIKDQSIISKIKLNPTKQLIASQCSGALILDALGLIEHQPVCTDQKTQKYLKDSNIEVLNQAFHAQNNIATAGGCLAAPYLAAWIIYKLFGKEKATKAFANTIPIGQTNNYIKTIEQFL